MIVCLIPPQMKDLCDLLGTPDAPVSKIASVESSESVKFIVKSNPSICEPFSNLLRPIRINLNPPECMLKDFHRIPCFQHILDIVLMKMFWEFGKEEVVWV